MPTSKPRRPFLTLSTATLNLCTTLFFIVLFTIPALFLLRFPSHPIPSSPCHSPSSSSTTTTSSSSSLAPFSGDLHATRLSWNHLNFNDHLPPHISLRIAVFSRKWPVSISPGGMENHAYTLHSTLARRGHRILVFTSPIGVNASTPSLAENLPLKVYFPKGQAGKWQPKKAWEKFLEENRKEPFDVIHSESVALPNSQAKDWPNVAVTWHGIALESLYSAFYQDLALRKKNVPFSAEFISSMTGVVPKIINEIRFFHNYTHHVAISDSCGEILRDVYQIPLERVHVILNGVDEESFYPKDADSVAQFRSNLGIPKNATVVLGAAGRLVKDKGHPLLFNAFSNIIKRIPSIYLVVAGSGPWEERYKELQPNVIVLGPVNAEKLGKFYNSIDVLINPTLRPQGLDLTLMEAMMCGKPVMAPTYPSIKGSAIVDEEFGFLFQPNVESLVAAIDAVVKEGRERLAQRGRACRDYANQMFGARKMAMAYERLFHCMKDEKYCVYP
ncbi:hypothetical protein MLD38_021323 [Melastoma candidum]|uniref:Uncharacterized protein n=1 Tax=Melastoma candidum TaxID=119954 RepID=A0ACB9QJ46_9MYRT|nr:hypothetical protein MLD38_021323 [Melastoma candidum]